MTSPQERARLLFEQGRYSEAVPVLESLTRSEPDVATHPSNLCYVYALLGQHAPAIKSGREAVVRDPGFVEAYANLGLALQLEGNYTEALSVFERGLELAPNDSGLWTGLGLTHYGMGSISLARTSYEKAITFNPQYVEAYCNLGICLQSAMEPELAQRYFKRALELNPRHRIAFSNYMMCRQYLPNLGREEESWLQNILSGSDVLTGVDSTPYEFVNARTVTRVGFVSADLYRHPVGYFLESLFKVSRADDYQFFCYSNLLHEDDLSQRLHETSNSWLNIVSLSDRELADKIFEDEIDVLIDLSGHTTGSRLGAFKFRPAPRQVSWLGFFASTGLPAIDYVLLSSDQAVEGAQAFYSEKIHQLDCCQFNYAPDLPIEIETSLPVERNGFITLGCFNNPAKIHAQLINLWVSILLAMPDSRLVLKWKSYSDTKTAEAIRAKFESSGLPRARLELRGASPHQQMMAEYNEIDIALDPFPFSGALTTCEALWMGVPVVTMPERRPVSRQSHSILKSVQLDDLSASSPLDYKNKVLALVQDSARRMALRQELRNRMRVAESENTERLANQLKHFVSDAS